MIRHGKSTDYAELGHIAYETGYFGENAETFFPDRALFSELWIRPYLDGVGCCNFVVQSQGLVTGYIIGTCDLDAYGRYFVRQTPKLLRGLLTGGYPRWRGCLPYLLRMLRYPSKTAPTKDFPAQLHINLLPESRGQGLGSQLLETYLECLKRKNVPGVQLSTTRENEAAIGLYKKVGFEVWLEYESPLWRPWLGRDAVHVVMTKRL